MPKATASKTAASRPTAASEKRTAKRLTSGPTHSCCCWLRSQILREQNAVALDERDLGPYDDHPNMMGTPDNHHS